MTVLTSVPLSTSAPSYADERFVVVRDPGPGTVVELSPGCRLAVTFRRGLGPSRWHVAALPGHVVLLASGGHEFQFLVFGGPGGSSPVRFERRHPDREIAHEVCELLVVPTPDPVSYAGARTSRSA
jgi:hypothetical protein